MALRVVGFAHRVEGGFRDQEGISVPLAGRGTSLSLATQTYVLG